MMITPALFHASIVIRQRKELWLLAHPHPALLKEEPETSRLLDATTSALFKFLIGLLHRTSD